MKWRARTGGVEGRGEVVGVKEEIQMEKNMINESGIL